MSGARIAKRVSNFSLIFLALLMCIAAEPDYGSLRSRVDAAPNYEAASDVVNKWMENEDVDPVFESAVADFNGQADGTSAAKAQALDNLRVRLKLRDLTSGAGPTIDTSQAKSAAKSIKESPYYSDPEKSESNWLSGSGERLMRLVPQIDCSPRMGGISAGGMWGGFTIIMYALLACILLVLLVLAVRHFTWKRRQKRVATALLEEDEPERSLDEWLAFAEELISQGRYREAVRALYLSCLLKFDEHNVARFDRGQTNWEHLARIQSSPHKPDAIDFRPPTKAFDRIWYGHHVDGMTDVNQFRQWYSDVTGALQGVRG